MLRTILCVGLVGLGALGNEPAAAADKPDVSRVESLGARVERNTDGDVTGVDLSNAWLTDADLEILAGLPQLERINLAYTKVTDLGLEHLAPLKNVKVLD